MLTKLLGKDKREPLQRLLQKDLAVLWNFLSAPNIKHSKNWRGRPNVYAITEGMVEQTEVEENVFRESGGGGGSIKYNGHVEDPCVITHHHLSGVRSRLRLIINATRNVRQTSPHFDGKFCGGERDLLHR